MPWMTKKVNFPKVLVPKLQFGHGTDAVDDSYNSDLMRAFVQLQFGHGTDAVDDQAWRGHR